MRVLVADDCAEDRALLLSMMSSWGYEAESVENGQEAKNRLLLQDGPVLAVLDWMMPGLDGPSVCRHVRQAVVDRYPYLLLLTARQRTEDLHFGLESGADDYLTKPFEADELYARLRAGTRIVALDQSLREANAQLAVQARQDALTGLLNRSAVSLALEQELARSRRSGHPLGVVVIDVDHFKMINDTFGHPVGDEVLREIARRLKSVIRASDSIGRWGGEEFLLVLPDCEPGHLAVRAEELRRVIATARVSVDHHYVPVTVSVGIAGGYRIIDPKQVIDSADAALYLAKRGGRNRAEVGALSRSRSPEIVAL